MYLMIPLCDHVYVPSYPHPVRKNHVVVSVSLFLTVLPRLAAWRNPSLIPPYGPNSEKCLLGGGTACFRWGTSFQSCFLD